MKIKEKWVIILTITLIGSMLYFINPMSSMAQDEPDPGSESSETTDTEVDDEEPAFSNPAQAQHAANLAEASASMAEADLAAATQEAEAAQTDLDAANAAEEPDPEQIAKLEEALATAESNLADATENSTGVSSEDIAGMRESGMGWGEIAHELGIHPGTLGLGHKKKAMANEMTQTTARNMKTGMSKGYGSAASGKGVGLGRTKEKEGVGKGSDGKGGGNAKDKGGGKDKDGGGGKGGGNSRGGGGGKDK